jgi:hypothetical protein
VNNKTKPPDASEIAGHRQAHARALMGGTDIGDDIFASLGQVGDTCVFTAKRFIPGRLRPRRKQRQVLDAPIRETVLRTGDDQMGMFVRVNHAQQQRYLPIYQASRRITNGFAGKGKGISEAVKRGLDGFRLKSSSSLMASLFPPPPLIL